MLRKKDILLVSLPWALSHQPSIQLGSLKSYLTSQSLSVIALHLHAYAPSIVGHDSYVLIQKNNLGEKVSTAAANPTNHNFFASKFKEEYPGIDWLLVLEQLAKYFDQWAQLIVSKPTKIVGFSCSLLQLMSSATVARKIKEIDPSRTVLIGGAALLGNIPKAILSNFSQFDYVLQGEGEVTLTEFLMAYPQGKEIDKIPGVWSRSNYKPLPRNPLSSLEQLPLPDFDDFFNIYPPVPEPRLTYEMSRGCFYGKCRFCNLNLIWNHPVPRRKSIEKIKDEISKLIIRYKAARLMFCDTNVSDKYDFFSEWRKDECPKIEFAGEVSAHLTRKNFIEMRLAGLKDIQIGIESFSANLLDKMNKGISVMRNVEIIRWCDELGIKLFYNIMAGYPEETELDRIECQQVMEFLMPFQWPRLAHYTVSVGSKLWDRLVAEGRQLTPESDFFFFFGHELKELAPALDPVVGLELDQDEIIPDNWTELYDLILKWQIAYENSKVHPGLTYQDTGSHIFIKRLIPARDYLIIDEPARSVLLFCEREAVDLLTIKKEFPDLDEYELFELLGQAQSNKILFCSDRKYFFLPVYEDQLYRMEKIINEVVV